MMKLVQLIGIIPEHQNIVLCDVDIKATVLWRGKFGDLPLHYWEFYVDSLQTSGKIINIGIYN